MDTLLRLFAYLSLCVVLLGTAACGIGQEQIPGQVGDGGVGESRASLIDPDRWEVVPLESDPFGDHRPVRILCDSQVYAVENFGGARVTEIDTGLCSYAALSQPLDLDVRRGDPIRIVLWHLNLTAREPAEAHVALGLGDDVLWEKRIPIPSDAELYDVEVPAPVDALAGTLLHFHLHNHGANSWRLQEVSVR